MFRIDMKKIFVIIITLFLMLISKPLLVANYSISVSFNQKSAQPIEYQVFWINDGSKKATEKLSVKHKTGNKSVKIKVSADEIKLFRLDIGVNPGVVEISDLKINGKPLDLNKFSKSADVESLVIDNDKMIITSNKRDPYLVYKEDVNAKGIAHINYPLFIILLSFWLVLSWFIVSFISKQENKTDAVFVLLFGILLFIPMLYISDANKSETENRTLAVSPDLFVDDDINNKYGTQFNDWFNDHFFGRDKFLSLYGSVKKTVSPNAGNEKVLIGKDGWLFYKGDSSLWKYANAYKMSANQQKKSLQYLQDIDSWCKKNGKTFYFIIAPDKNRIYGENIRFVNKIRSDEFSVGHQFSKYVQENSDINVIYLYDVLQKNKDKGLLYYKNDTHWNYFGAYFAYKEIMNKIKEKYNSVKDVEYDKMNYETKEIGDLTKMVDGLYQKDLTKYNNPNINDTAKCEYNTPNKNERNGFICTNTTSKKRVFILRDSFATSLAKYFNNTFNTVKYEWKHELNKTDLDYIKNNSDIVILEKVERLIPRLSDTKFPKE